MCLNVTLKNAGLNKTQRWVKYYQPQQLDFCPEGWVKHLTQRLVENNLIAGFVCPYFTQCWVVFNPALLEWFFWAL